MYECRILLGLPLVSTESPETGTGSVNIATYNFDPGLREGDEVVVENWGVGWNSSEEILNCIALVVKRSRCIVPRKNKEEDHLFVDRIFLEIADKEQLPQICEILRRLNPGKFKA